MAGGEIYGDGATQGPGLRGRQPAPCSEHSGSRHPLDLQGGKGLAGCMNETQGIAISRITLDNGNQRDC